MPAAGAIVPAGAIVAAGPDAKAAGPDFGAAGPDFEAAGPDFEAAGPDFEAQRAHVGPRGGTPLEGPRGPCGSTPVGAHGPTWSPPGPYGPQGALVFLN